MVQIIGDHIRAEFKRLLRDFVTTKAAGKFLSTTHSNITTMKNRSCLSPEMAKRAERRSKGKYKAHLLVKKINVKYYPCPYTKAQCDMEIGCLGCEHRRMK